MKVTLTKHGGLAAGMRRPPRVVDSSELPEPAGAELHRLVAAVKATPRVTNEGPGRARDAMSYTIKVEDDSGEPATFTQSDVNLSPEFASLLQWMERRGSGSS